MSNPVKITLYIALIILAVVSGYFAMTNFGRMMARAGDRTSALEQIEPERKRPAEESAAQNASITPAAPSTNQASAATNEAVVATNAITTDEANVGTNAVVAASEPTNTTALATNTAQAIEVPTALTSRAGTKETKSSGRIGLWTGLFILTLIGLGLLIASDVSHYFGNRALKVLYNDEGDGQKNPDYDKAEEVWANGDHLEAIRMMRDYLARNPREQHVAIRIAEIYEKDLKNNLAAALEYEEVLKHKLPGERWAWAAIHLCNLYFRLNHEEKGFALLRRIVKEHPATSAADKARKRLEQVDGVAPEQLHTEPQVSTVPQMKPSPPPSPASTNLPPGFRPKR